MSELIKAEQLQPKPAGRTLRSLPADIVARAGEVVIKWCMGLGNFSIFVGQTLMWLFTRLPRRETLIPNFHKIGVESLPVVALTGTFIGMVLVVQAYVQFRDLNMETKLGSVITMTLFRELGPVLAATMLAGRVGSAMAAELGTMRVTEQIDALESMGANPIHYLVVPRFLGCLLLIPVLTIFADFMGMLGAFFYAVYLLDIDFHHYLSNSQSFVGVADLFIGVFKSLFFGAAIALTACHRGFYCDPGAEGVGRAATVSFVQSFVLILIIDLLLGIALDGVYFSIWPKAPSFF